LLLKVKPTIPGDFPIYQAHIAKNYEQFWPEPPFPAFSSGHATQSPLRVALTSIFGETYIGSNAMKTVHLI
jgi:hypothetical protein